MAGHLHGYRVVDIADRALLAGAMMAQLGAEVIQVEPPEGSAARHLPPFDTRAGEPRSLHWAAFAAGKRSVTLDLESAAGQEAFRALVASAHFLLESETPGAMERRGLGHEALLAINPGLIHVAITPFGSDGPKAQWEESDLVLWAAGGPLYLNRDGLRPPLRISLPQAWLHGAADAVGGALLAHLARMRSGRGQHVDVSVQQSVLQATLSATTAALVGHEDFSLIPKALSFETKRTLDLSGSGSRTRRSKWPAADGLVEMHLAMGPATGGRTNKLFAWMKEEGALPPHLHDWDWTRVPERYESGEIDDDDIEAARDVVGEFLASRTKDALAAEAMRRQILLAPLCTTKDLVTSPHHAERGFFERFDEYGLERTLPGAFAMGTCGIVPRKPAPALGQDNDLLHELVPLRPSAASAATSALPLADLKVVDLAWVVAGPAIGRVLADFGATVVRVESSKRIDTARMMGPFPDGQMDINRSALFETFNAGKLGLTLDLASEEGRGILRDLASWADVLIESFAPGQMARWGLGFEQLTAINPRLVMLSTSLMGQSGPYRTYAGYGNVGAAMAGFQNIVGWPDALPIGPFGPYTDYVGPRFGLVALLAALASRDGDARGTWLDISQAEAGIQFIAPLIAEYAASGAIAGAHGNRAPDMVPHGVFHCAGDDQWIAIAVRDDGEWARLAKLIGGEAGEPTLASFAARAADPDRVEAIVDSWTATMDPHHLTTLLQEQGIPAHIVASARDIAADDQLKHRGHFIRLPHERGGETIVEAPRYRLSGTPGSPMRAAPTLGRDNEAVLAMLGRTPDEIRSLTERGVLT